MKTKAIFGTFLLLAIFSTTLFSQEIPQKISFQGKLLENGVPVNGNKPISFTIGTWTEYHPSVEINDGLYSVVLGSVNPIPISIFNTTSSIELQIEVDGEILSPNTQIQAVGYAFKSEKAVDAEQINGRTVSGNPQNNQVLKWNGAAWNPATDETGSGITTLNSGNGINIQNPNGPESTISIASGGVGNTLIANDAITSDKIQNGTISTSDLNFSPISNPYNNALTVNDLITAEKLKIGTPYTSIGTGDLALSDNMYVEGEFHGFGGIISGNPSSSTSDGDITAEGDIIAEDDLVANDELFVTDDANIDGDLFVLGEADLHIFTGFHDNADLGHVINIRNNFMDPLGTTMMLANNDFIIETINNYNRVLIESNFSVTGTKNATVKTETYGQRKTYCDESTEVYFFDRGSSKMNKGQVTISLEPIFLETVTIDDTNPMLVQITLTGNCNGIYISEKTKTGFIVKELLNGVSNASFDWEVAAKRKGYEQVRLEQDDYISKTK